MIDSKEIMLAGECIRSAIANGADEARVSLSKSVMDGYTFLNGELDKVTHSADRSIYISLFVDGRYGTFSTNRLERDELETFIARAVSMTRMLGEDRFRRLPDPGRTEKGPYNMRKCKKKGKQRLLGTGNPTPKTGKVLVRDAGQRGKAF